MLKRIFLALAAALLVAVPAQARELKLPDTTRLIPEGKQLNADVVEVQSTRRPAASIILTDTVGGAAVGTAVGGGVALYHRYVENGSDGSWGNWQRDLLLGAAIGGAAGLVFGIVDAASQDSGTTTNRVVTEPAADRREVGFSPPVAEWGGRF